MMIPALKIELSIILTFFSSLFLTNTVYSQQSIRINEFLASNSTTLTDKDGEFSDWIEIYNSSSNNISLSGWSLTDDKTDTLQWIFPEVVLNANDYLLIFASGKDYSIPSEELHTNFKLDAEGEYLALFDDGGNVVTEFDTFPEQQSDVSFGFFDGNFFPSITPTPGTANILNEDVVLPLPEFNFEQGFYDNPFEIIITTDVLNSEIYYTIDASEPNAANGILYKSAVTINTTTVLRAVVVKNGIIKSKIKTSTFLFLEDVISQPNDPEGYPSEWGRYYEIEGRAIADYEMDPEIKRNRDYSDLLKDALLSLPVISIVTDKNNLFSHKEDPDSGGIYVFTGPPGNSEGNEPGGGWERPASVEYFNDNIGENFQIDCGLRIHGGHSRRPEKTPKHSFRIIFRSEYGESKLNYSFFGDDAADSFNSIVLRATYGNTWLHRSASERNHALLLHDVWAKDTQLDMGNPSGHGKFVHLYLNGIYWGIYNPTERIDKEFAQYYLGGNEEDYDIIKDYGEVAEGNNTAWQEMMNMINNDLSDNTNYYKIFGKNSDGTDNPNYKSYLDLENFIDYMIINLYGANWDWDGHNWIAVRNRVNPGKGFKFYSWDAEHILESINSNILDINNNNRPSRIYQQLKQNKNFVRLFGDRVQKHFFNDGVLTPKASTDRLLKRADEIELAIIAESARWGDYRRDVHQYYPSGPFDLYTKEHWLKELSFLTDEYFPNRGEVFLDQLKDAGLFPEINAPAFLINNEEKIEENINPGDTLTMSALGGTIYYTLDGTDPFINGTVSPNALTYTKPIILNQRVHVKARRFYRDVLSALNEKLFVIPGEINDLKITEIHYHPLPEDTIADGNFEFIELKNIGSSSIDISGVEFIEGLSYTFSDGVFLSPNEFIVLASNQNYFNLRYNFIPFGEFTGSVDNSGERIVLTNSSGDTLINIRYDDSAPWPETPDGDGYSLVPTELNPTGDQNDPVKWRASINIHGSPGKDDDGSTDLEQIDFVKPDSYKLYQNYPNPFNSFTTIQFSIPERTFVNLEVFDVLGNRIAVLVNEEKSPGTFNVLFDGSKLASGVYYYKMKANHYIQTGKMIILK